MLNIEVNFLTKLTDKEIKHAHKVFKEKLAEKECISRTLMKECGCYPKPLKPKRNTKCCHCGRTWAELKKLDIGLDEVKDVVGGDDWNWWCDDCYIQMVGQECEICHDISTYGVIRCPKCKTILCSICAKGHNCGIINRIRRFFRTGHF